MNFDSTTAALNINNPSNQSYWFVLREDQNNVVLSSNNFTIQNPVGTDGRYVIDTGHRQYIQLAKEPNEPGVIESTVEIVTTQNPSDGFWDRHKVKVLLNLSSDIKYKNCNPKDKAMWKDIAPIIDTTPEQCRQKYMNLKKTFIRVHKQRLLGKETKWVHYNICQETFKKYKLMSPESLDYWDENKTRRLLILYLEKFCESQIVYKSKKDLWKEISTILGVTDFSCHCKFRSLKRTYIKILERTRQTGKLVKWPYLPYFERIGVEIPCNRWHKNQIKLLLDAYSQRTHKFADPHHLKKDLWCEISTIVGESPSDCDKKFRNLKGTYFKLKKMENSGKTLSKWRYYKYFEAINKIYENDNVDKSFARYRVENCVKEMLAFYLENKEKFNNPLIKNKLLWKQISGRINMYPEECDKKFRNLKQTYIRLAEKRKLSGKQVGWPYFTYFEKIYGDSISPSKDSNSQVVYSELKKFVQDVQDNRDRDHKFERLMSAVEESNKIQRERNRILQALLNKYN